MAATLKALNRCGSVPVHAFDSSLHVILLLYYSPTCVIIRVGRAKHRFAGP